MSIMVNGSAGASPYSVLRPSVTARPAGAVADGDTAPDLGRSEPDSASGALQSRPLSGFAPAVHLSSAQMLALQSDLIRAPDAAKTAAQNDSRAFAVIRDAGTGKLLGGVWPEAGVWSGPDIGSDSRLSSSNDMGQVTQALAGDIEKATGRAVSIQYFQSGDSAAPTFGSIGQMI
ncbi:MAG: hypothetical protein F8N37_13895 [Telmatospirillum sp.]|nr:hypothetical protein [Telmatospirillum sp.]